MSKDEEDKSMTDTTQLAPTIDVERLKQATLALFSTPRWAYYEWGNNPPKREWHTVLGVAITAPNPSESHASTASGLYHSTWLLVERADRQLTWMDIGQLTMGDQP